MDELVELTIDSLSYGGRGVGRYNGKAVFVPLVLPDELVQCRVVKDKKRYCEAELVAVIKASTDRREPPCRFFPECGGCQWQHIPYRTQLYWKEKIFTDTLIRATGCDTAQILPIIAAPDEFGYRCRAQIKFRMTDQGLVAGFYRTGTHHIVDTDNCLILDSLIPPVLDRFRDSVASFSQADRIKQVDFCVDSVSRISLVVHFSGTDVAGLGKALQTMAADDSLSLYLQPDHNKVLKTLPESTPQIITPEDDNVLHLEFPPGGFTQINLLQNRRLVKEVLKGAVHTGFERVLDLYSGVGNFSLPLARICAEVVGVEEYSPGVDAAIQNARSNKLDNVSFIVGRAERIIEQLVKSSRFNTVVLDPPRSGAAQVIKSLLQMQSERIVYVSCDPTTMARDLSALLHNGYRLLSARPVDMFPQTWHIEGVAVLARSDIDSGL